MGIEEVLEHVADAELLTNKGGQISISEIQMRQVAVYSNGIVLYADDYRWSPEFKSIERQARARGYAFKKMKRVEASLLEEIYRKNTGKSDPVQAQLTLERQAALAEIISKAAREGASDIVIRVLKGYTELRTRVFGRMKDLESRKEDEGIALIMAAFSVSSDQAGASSIYSLMQGALTEKSGLLPPRVEMIRLQYSYTSDGRGALVMRLKYEAPANEIEIDHLGYNAQQISDISTMRRRTNGLYVLAGKVSSGKSTTLQRALNKMYIEKRREISIYTIEEPVELDLPGAIQVPAKKGKDGTDGFTEAMKASLRSDPNIIVLGEIRSRELSYLAIQAVMTGHALWSTVHAGSALGILDRLVDLGVEMWKLSDPTVVRGLVYQRLTGVLCDGCKVNLREGVKNKTLEGDLAKRLVNLFRKKPEDLYVRGPGCSKCKMGLSGRTVVAETILTDPHMLDLYAKGDRAGMRKYWLKKKSDGGLGGIPVLHHALAKVGAGICDINEVEEEVDLLSVYENDYMFLHDQLLEDVREVQNSLESGK